MTFAPAPAGAQPEQTVETSITIMSKPRIVENKDGSVTVRLRNVRCSFPDLFVAKAFEEGKTPTFNCTALMPRQNDPEKNLEYVKQGIALVVKNGLGGVHPGADRVCVKSGKEKGERGIAGYSADMAFVGASCRKRPVVVDRDMTPLNGENGRPYGGCYVNMSIRLWAQDGKKQPKWGKRVNAQLRAVQFWADGEPFGTSGVDAEEEFDGEGGEGATPASADDLL